MKTIQQLNELNNNFKIETQFKLIFKHNDYKSQSPKKPIETPNTVLLNHIHNEM